MYILSTWETQNRWPSYTVIAYLLYYIFAHLPHSLLSRLLLIRPAELPYNSRACFPCSHRNPVPAQCAQGARLCISAHWNKIISMTDAWTIKSFRTLNDATLILEMMFPWLLVNTKDLKCNCWIYHKCDIVALGNSHPTSTLDFKHSIYAF